MHNTK